MSALRSAARVVAKKALRPSASATSTAATVAQRARVVGAASLRSAPTQYSSVRFCSSSRFLSLADDDKKASTGEDGAEGGTADGEDGEGADAEKAEGEDEDGDLKLDEEADINEGGVDICEETDEEVMQLFMENPVKWTSEKLARKFHLTKPRVEAIIYLKGEEAGLTPEEFELKIKAAKEAAQARMDEEAAHLARAEAAGDEKEVRRLQKRERQSLDQEENEELSAHDEALLMGIDEDAYRNPDFFFLNDEFEGYPPLVRRLGKHGSTDKLFPEEALTLQKLAVNNKVEELKSFAKPTDVTGKWKIAVKDISKKKKPLYMRAEDKTLRLATDSETLPRTWVRRPSFFSGLEN
uniref:Uncharacterized protein n=1 Tax=Globisporangium ultimum (strain ATCC 200006 / CBS 805.95 / DAOM BR144) TaxID=431595 RepID=K3WIB3_GLOUD